MRVVFIGTGEIGLPTLQALLAAPAYEIVGAVTQPDKPVGRAQKIQPSPIKAALAETGIPVLQPARLREQSAVDALRVLTPDVIVVMAYGQILSQAVLELPRLACLNLHASLLPKYRGAAPIQAAIAAGESETGITVMFMDAGLDTGDILLQTRLPILPDETGGSLHDRLAEVAPDALLQALDLLAAGKAPRRPQEAELASYAPKLERANGEIDWQQEGVAIEQKIRAFDPWPGAFTEITDSHGQTRQLKIFRATLIANSTGAPGTITRPDGEMVIATGRGGLRLDLVQLEGKRRMTSAEFFRGFSSPTLRF